MSSGTASFLDPLNIIPTLGLVTGMIVGLVGIWNTIKNQKRETKKDIESSNQALEGRLKEFFDARFKVVDVQNIGINQRIDRQMGDIKDTIKGHSELIDKRISERENFFKEWIQRIEDEVDTKRHSSKTTKR